MVSRFLYVPNLIGYTRVALMFTAYYVYESKPIIFFLCYFLSQFLDMFDGMAARHFNQSTNFGAMLDMVTDRCSTCGLMLTISKRLPQYTMLCHIFIWIDICSHWAHMLASLRAGSQSHKLVTSGPALLQYYYKTHWFMVLLIFGAEGAPLVLYLLSFEQIKPLYPIFKCLGILCAPLFVLKHLINVIQFTNASKMLDELHSEEKSK